ncbi:Nif3-like dinuclear metal center hexameric protein [Flavitalea flava]
MPLRPTNENSFSGRWKRREFLSSALGVLAGSSLLTGFHPAKAVGSGLTIRQVIDIIVATIPGAPFKETVDTVKSGDPDQPVKGIVTTMFATDAVIEKTIGLGANFIIAHEPTFYTHQDKTDWLADDPVFRFKKDLLEKHGIVVWRFHDYIHTLRPDGILMGVLTSLGWEKYYNEAAPEILTIPATSLKDIIKHAKKQLGIEKVKVIGDLSQSCQRVVVMPGAWGGDAQIKTVRKYKPDLLICGELNEWETSEYIRDARYQGQETSLVVLGHSVSEEPGMEWLLPWLQPKVPGIKISHVPSGEAFSWA